MLVKLSIAVGFVIALMTYGEISLDEERHTLMHHAGHFPHQRSSAANPS